MIVIGIFCFSLNLKLNSLSHILTCFVVYFSVYEGDDYAYKFAAKDEDERDCWIQALHIASYECLKMQLQSLREQIQARTGRDPISQTMPTETEMEFETGAGMNMSN